MKTKIRIEHASMLEVSDWLAESRDADGAELTGPGLADPDYADPTGPGYAVPASYSYAVPAGPGYAGPADHVRAVPASPGYAVPTDHGRAGPADDSAQPESPAGPVAPAASAVPAATTAPARTAPSAVPARTAPSAVLARPAAPAAPDRPAAPAAPAAPAGPARAIARAVIGDQLRMPVMRCELGSCISWHADPAALGEADARARAIGAGWRLDAFGRLACPRCQQTDPGYWPACRVVPWERSMAGARIPAMPGEGTDALRGSRDPGRAARGYPPFSRAELERHHEFPAAEAMPADRYAADLAGTSHSRGAVLNAVRAWRTRGGRRAAARQASEPGEDLMMAEHTHAGSADEMTSTGQWQ